MKKLRKLLTLSCVVLFGVNLASAQSVSKLWGRAGEKWNPKGRLPDFSHAGYHSGAKAIPTVKQVADVKTFGAKGDGRTDDSDAFIKAIASVSGGAIYIPPGRYKITKIIEIAKSGVVLRGAGAKKTFLVFPTPLNDIKPNMGQTTSGRPTSNYSWSGGLIWFKGGIRSGDLTTIIAPAKRGGREFKVASTDKLKPGQWIQIYLRDDKNKSLLNHLYSGDPGDTSKIRAGSHRVSLPCRVVSAGAGRMTIDRYLPLDIQLAWSPKIKLFAPTVTECGIEDVCFLFPPRQYKGHFTELGYNAISFSGVVNCWARNIRIVNADSGVFAHGRFCTVQRISLETDGAKTNKGGVFGHHGVTLGGSDNLLTQFDIRMQFIHDVTMARSWGNVTSNGRGVNLCFDHHKRAPFANLFTNLDLGAGGRMWRCGGGRSLGRHCGAFGTFWNIRAKKSQDHPGGFGPASMNLVGVETTRPSKTVMSGIWFEAIKPKSLVPQNLHEAQLKRRLANSSKK
jgi:hypothetical protein